MTDEKAPGLPAKTTNKPVITRNRPNGQVALTEAGYELLAALGEEGITIKSAAAVLGIAPVTFRDLLKRDEKAVEAFAEGRARLERALVHRLVSEAKDPDQKNPAFLLFAHKALLGIDEKGPAETKAAAVNVTINLPGAARSPEEFARIINPEPDDDASR